MAVPRSIPLLMLLALPACTNAASTPPDIRFVLADPNKYKTDVEKARALDLVQTACKAKAMTASAELEKTIASERHSLQNVDRAHEKGAEMYTTAFTLCMLSSGYVRNS
jgi:hypothetical protein